MVFAFLLAQLSAFALQSVTLVWDPSPDSTVIGYNIYYGTVSGVYPSKLTVGAVTNATIENLVEGTTYYFAATAFNAAGLESDPSNEVSYTVPVVPIPNRPPTLNLISDLAINEDAGSQSVVLSGISSGASNEVQTLSVTAISSNPGLIPNPVINYSSPNATGTLLLAPVANGDGAAVISVTVDDGQSQSNTITRTFTVNVTPVNDPPTLQAIGDVTVTEDAGLQTITLAGIGPGSANESQTLVVSAVSSNPSLVPTPSVSYISPSASGTLTLAPVANGSGSANITVTVNDGQAQNNTVTRTFKVTVSPVNDPPTLNPLNNLVIDENAGPQGVGLAGISSGPSDENETVTVTATSSNPALIPNPSVSYSKPNTTGSLSFTPATNAFGTATITVTINDGQAQNSTVVRTFTVTVNWLNQRPTLNTLSNLSLPGSAGMQTVNLSGISSGATNEPQTLVVTASSSNPALIPNPTVNYTTPNTIGTATFTPTPNLSGTAVITVTVDDGQALNNTLSRTFTITVNWTNQAPTLSAIGNLTINEDASSQTVTLAGISSGATNENQALSLTATSSNPGLIAAPTISYSSPNTTGTLSFTPLADASGTATITVSVNDGQAQNNVTSRSFTVTVNAVNDAPKLDPLPDAVVIQNAPSQTVNLSGISSGATNENQTLTVTALSSNPGVVPNPAVSYSTPGSTGTLVFTPASNTAGSATITVTVNDGQAQNNTISRTFTVTVNAPPSISSIADQVIAVSTPTAPIAFTVSDADTAPGALVLSAWSANPALLPTNRIAFGGSGSNRTVTLTPVIGQTGAVQVAISVSDGSSTASNNFRLTVLGKPSGPGNFHIHISGSGKLLPDLSGKDLLLGKTYTVTAVPASGQEFAGWSGGLVSSQPTITFVMSSNLLLKANFVPSPFIPVQGMYNGLFRDSQVQQESSGYFAVSVNYRGKYSGYLRLGAKRLPFSGRFNLDGLATNAISRRGQGPLALELNLGFGTQADGVTGSLRDTNWTATLAGARAVFHSRTNPAPYAGVYTLVLPGFDGVSALPAGNGFASLRITPAGISLISGRLADGTVFNQGAYISREGLWPFYAPLYTGSGSVLSWLTFTNRETDDINGLVSWIKPAQARSRYYTNGFTTECSAVGSAYTKPVGATARVLNLQNALLSFKGGNLSPDFENSITLDARGRVTNLSSNRLVFNFNIALGLFSGAVIDPSSGQPYRFMGAALQKHNAAYGALFGTDQTSDVMLAP